MILDIIAVNLSYFSALIMRYYLRFRLVPAAAEFFSIFYKFAPIYSVVCVVVFLLFRLYGGMWEYVSSRDINRIVLGSLCASVLYVIGTTVLFKHMPITYYAIGAVAQLVLVLVIRYAHRIVDIERVRLAGRNTPTQRLMIVGADVTAKKVLKHLESETALQPVVVADDKSREKSLYGLPVVADVKEAIDRFEVNGVLIADPLLSDSKRNALAQICEEKGIALYDYTGFLKNQSGALPLADVARLIDGPATVRVGDATYESIEKAMQAMNGRYRVEAISGRDLTISVKPDDGSVAMEDWAQKYKQETGEDVSFF